MYINQQSQQKTHATPGIPISTNTIRIQNLLPRYLDVLKDTPDHLQVSKNIPVHIFEDDESEWWIEEGPWVLGFLVETLDNYAPEGYSFENTHNLTDFGYWLCNDILLAGGWICTYPDTGQWAKKASCISRCPDGKHRKIPDNFAWYYFDNGDGPENATLINIRNYTIKQIESTISS